MAKQLEEALKRPAAPMPPPPAQPHASQAEDTADEDDLLEPGRDQEPLRDFHEEEHEDFVEEPAPAPQPEPPRPVMEPARPAPSPLPPKPQPEPAAATPASQKATDPFSVEEIEAEFARLLGRPLDSGKKG
jgi:hypothetical protein